MVTNEHIVGCIAKPPVGTSSAPTPPTAYSILPNIFTLWISGFLLKTQNILQQFLVCTKRSLSQIYALTGIKFWFGRAIGLALWWHTERNSRSLSSDHMANQLPCNRHFSDLLFLAQWVHSAYCSWLHWEEVDEWQGCQGCQLCPLHITSRHPLRHSPRHIRNKNKNIENEKKKTLPAPSPFLSTHFLLILIRQYKTPPTIGTIEYEDIKKDQSANWGTQSKIKRTKDCTIVKSAHLKGNFRKRWNFSHVQKFLVIFKITKFLEFLVVSIIGETSSTTNSIWQLLARNNITFNHQFTDQPKSTPVLLAVTATGYHQVIVTIINH